MRVPENALTVPGCTSPMRTGASRFWTLRPGRFTVRVVDDADRLAEVGEMNVDCETGGELFDRARQEPGRGDRGVGEHSASNSTS